MEQEERGISLLQFFKILFGRKIVLLISMVVTLIVGILVTTLYYNKNKISYVANYTYVSENLTNGEYADGSKYEYSLLINLDVYNEIKKSDSLFDNLDVEKLYNSGAISISETKKEIVSNNKEENIVKYRNEYTITTLKKYFPNYAVAQKFIECLSKYPVNKENKILDSKNYISYLNLYKSATTYDEKVNLLILQKEMLTEKYKELFKLYGDVSVNDTTVKSSMNSFELYFTSNNLEDLLNQIVAEGFSLNNELEDLKLKKQALEVLKAQNEEKISSLQDQIQILIDKVGASNISSINLDSYNEKIVEYTTQNVDYDTEIQAIDRKISNTGSTDETYLAKKTKFDEILNVYFSKINNFTEEFKNISSTIEKENTYVLYSSSSIINQTGGVRIIIAIVGSLVFGLMIGCVINLCLDHDKFSPKKEEVSQ